MSAGNGSAGKDVPTPFKQEEIAAYFLEHKVAAKCPMCETSAWSAMAENFERDSVILPMMNADGQTDFTKIVRAFVLVCKNCGFLWPTARNIMETWILTKRNQQK